MKVKIIQEKEVIKVKDLVKQNYLIGDASGAAILTVWEKNVGVLKQGTSYKLSGVMVRVYNNKKYLSIPKEQCDISSIDDIGDVQEEESEVDSGCYLEGVLITGLKLDIYSSCCVCYYVIMLHCVHSTYRSIYPLHHQRGVSVP